MGGGGGKGLLALEAEPSGAKGRVVGRRTWACIPVIVVSVRIERTRPPALAARRAASSRAAPSFACVACTAPDPPAV